MHKSYRILPMLLTAAFMSTPVLADSSNTDNGLKEEVADFNKKSSTDDESTQPSGSQVSLSYAPKDLGDGIPVGKLGLDGGDQALIAKLAKEMASESKKKFDSLLIAHKGKLVFESYFNKGRVDHPHIVMSITKSLTALALGRAMEMGHVSMTDLDKPVLDILTKVDKSKACDGADQVTLAEVLNLQSGIRKDNALYKKVSKGQKLKGQKMVEVMFASSKPIKKEWQYGGTDPTIAMTVLDTLVPNSSFEFIKNDFFGKMGITNYKWPKDKNSLPRAAAGVEMTSRDMLKIGLMMQQKGKWQGEQLIPTEYMEKAMSALWPGKHNGAYGYFIWNKDVEIGGKRSGGKKVSCISCRGAAGQFILIYPEMDLVVVSTAKIKGGGPMLDLAPERILPAFNK
ncbi:serine hydrolase [Lentisphaera marina]|uniref:serine hydrolase domain-containing protein n=1 Tax=Lentisphaera marina TaxID=1111041 RepID=UPI0023654E9E|nr:serine hydrolase [Lentisphaera marina]MDD7984620.1 serine hydrolase [Lentisphaera marina]